MRTATRSAAGNTPEINGDALAEVLAKDQRAPAIVGIVGNFGTGNYGNEASLAAIIDIVRRHYPEARFRCFCLDPGAVQRDHHIEAVTARHVRAPNQTQLVHVLYRLAEPVMLWLLLRDVGMLFIPGTALFEDVGERPSGMPRTLFWITVAARLRGVWIAIVSGGAGPIRARLSRWYLHGAFRLAHYRSWRDTYSRDQLSAYGFKADHDPVFPDIAFHLETARERRAPPERPTAAIGVMSHLGDGTKGRSADAAFEHYIDGLVKVGRQLLEAGFAIRVIAGENSDAITAARYVDILQVHARDAASVTLHNSRTFSDICNVVSDADVVIASRFHNLVAGLKMGVPCLSLGYSPRHDELLRGHGLGAQSHAMSDFDAELVTAQALELADRASSWRRIVTAKSALTKAAARSQEPALVTRLGR